MTVEDTCEKVCRREALLCVLFAPVEAELDLKRNNGDLNLFVYSNNYTKKCSVKDRKIRKKRHCLRIVL